MPRAAVLDYCQKRSDRPRHFVSLLSAKMMLEAGLVEQISHRLFRRLAHPQRKPVKHLARVPHTIVDQLQACLDTSASSASFLPLLPSAEVPGLRFEPPTNTSSEQLEQDAELRAAAVTFVAGKVWK